MRSSGTLEALGLKGNPRGETLRFTPGIDHMRSSGTLEALGLSAGSRQGLTLLSFCHTIYLTGCLAGGVQGGEVWFRRMYSDALIVGACLR